MKTLAELKEMMFISHHDCVLCKTMVGWYVQSKRDNPYFDPSCDCGGSSGHYETWEQVFKWYNVVFEKESEKDVLEATKSPPNKATMDMIIDLNKLPKTNHIDFDFLALRGR